MHELIQQLGGWTLETLRDDTDQNKAEGNIINKLTNNNENSLEDQLNGCCFVKEVKSDQYWIAEIRYEEQSHDELVFVEAVVFKRKGKLCLENTEHDIAYFRRGIFLGYGCKTRAAAYASKLLNKIEDDYFQKTKNFLKQ